MHKRSRSAEPSSKVDEHRCGILGPTASDDSVTGKAAAAAASSPTTAHCSTVSVYLASINGVRRLITAVWNKSIINQSFTISIEPPSDVAAAAAGGGGGGDDGTFSHKVELKPWPFWSKKGLKSLVLDGDRLDIFWDLRSAKFAASSPEPVGGYYIALVMKEEVFLMLGDLKKEGYKRSKARPSLEDAVPVCRRESVFSRRSFTARASLDAGTKKHEIVVETSLAGTREPEMSITVDGEVLVRVKNLQWKFRGNQTVFVGQSPVQVLWDAHDWIFAGPVAQAVIVFKPGEIWGEDVDMSAVHCDMAAEYCFFLHAWKTE